MGNLQVFEPSLLALYKRKKVANNSFSGNHALTRCYKFEYSVNRSTLDIVNILVFEDYFFVLLKSIQDMTSLKRIKLYLFSTILMLLVIPICGAMPCDSIVAVAVATDNLFTENRYNPLPASLGSAKKDTIGSETINSFYLLHNDFIRQSIAPAFFLTSSFLTWGERKNIREVRNRYVPNFSNHLDNYMQYAPAMGVLGLNVAGVKGRNGWKRQTVNWGTSMLIMGILVNSIKYSAKVMRPDGSSRNSFPSGHTATAFMNATFLHKEYGHISPFYSIAGYASSSYVGTSRSLNNRHWISDILAGAAIGIVSTELSYAIVDHFYKNKGDYFSGFTVQEEIEKPSYISARMGYSFDVTGGHFSALGVESSIEGAYYFSKRWGIVGEITFGNYPFNKQQWEGGDLELPEVIIRNPQADFQSMGMLYFMAGPQYTKKMGSKFLLQTKVTAGMSVGAKGEMSLVGIAENKVTGIQNNVTLPLVDYKPRAGFVVGTGASVTAMVTPSVGLTWFVDYKYSRPTFDITPSNRTFGNNLDYIHEKSSVNLNNLSSGLRFTAFFE